MMHHASEYDELDPRHDMQPHLPRILHREVFYKDTLIIHQGGDGNRAFFIEKGKVEVLVQEGAHMVKVAELGPGEIFGEMALIEHTPRSATVRALSDTTVTVIAAHELEKKISPMEMEAGGALLHVMIERLRDANKVQLSRHREFAEFQDRIAGLVDKAENGIEESRRAKFRADVTPLLERLDSLLDEYR